MDDQETPSELPFFEAVRALPVIACVVGPDGEVLVTNDAWRRFEANEDDDGPAPPSEGEHYLEACQRMADDPYATEVAEAFERLLAGEIEQYRTTYPSPSPDGERWFDLLASRLDLEGEPYVLAQHLDTTAQTQAELETHEQVERLEALARVLSHDLRTPLSVASGYCRLLDEEIESEHLDKVEEALERISTIAENAVLIARGTEVSETEEIDLESFAKRIWGSLDTDDATLTVESVMVEGDPGLLSELLENLFRNVLEHAGEEPKVVVGRVTDDGGFYVADDGPGIPPDVREEVFDIGYTTGTGTGFGLDIVKRIADAHGWTIQATESEEGGARFELRTGDD
jgi:signal transduction histidine kinase